MKTFTLTMKARIFKLITVRWAVKVVAMNVEVSLKGQEINYYIALGGKKEHKCLVCGIRVIYNRLTGLNLAERFQVKPEIDVMTLPTGEALSRRFQPALSCCYENQM